MAKKHILLIDGNSLMHANHNGMSLSVGGMQVQAIFGMLKSLHAMAKATPGEKELIVLWDGRAEFRLDIYPAYKGNRAPMDAKAEAHKQAFKRQVPFVEKSLSLLGIRQMRSPLLEADDLAGHLVPMLVQSGHEVTMVSGDKDWLQMVGPSVCWFDPIRDRRVDASNFLDFTGYFTTDAFLHGKALQGDSSDNITGVGGFGEKGAALFMAQWKSVENFFESVDAGTYQPKTRASKTATSLHPEQLLACPDRGREVFRRNVKLMDWRQSRKPEPGELITTRGLADAVGFEAFCQRLAFQSIIRELSMFLKSFNITYTLESK